MSRDESGPALRAVVRPDHVSCREPVPTPSRSIGWKLFDVEPPETIADLSCRGWMNLEAQPGFRQRASLVVDLVGFCQEIGDYPTVTELGCGDGSLLARLVRPNVVCWGYEIGEADVRYAQVLGRDVRLGDIVSGYSNGSRLDYGSIVVLSEVLEHLEDPLSFLQQKLPIRLVIASSPSKETQFWYNPIHAWAWDTKSYRELFELAGYKVLYHAECDGGINTFNGVAGPQGFQAIVAVKR